jgi:ligand-binding sensor domain-containing protein/DNA-binding CsgD family transcriptional regulator
MPPIRHFPKSVYQAGTQTWAMLQDRRGVLYMANNDGLLEFDGQNWTRYPLPNQTILRSLALDTLSGRIYAGGQGELGYFFPDASGRLSFTSLTELLPENDRRFEDVWNIIALGESVFFHTRDHIFQLENERIQSYTPGGALHFMGAWNGQLWVQRGYRELLVFHDGAFETAVADLPFSNEITAFLPFRGDTLLMATLKSGLFSFKDGRIDAWKTQNDALLSTHRIYCAAVLPGYRLALGTTSLGVIVLLPDGRVHRVISRSSGLQQNNVLSLFPDRDHNLWVGLDNGIDYIETNSAISRIYPDNNQEATGYAVHIHKGRIFFGTSNGLYSAPWSLQYDPLLPVPFELMDGTTGQVWSLNTVAGDLIMGHHEGPFWIRDQTSERLAKQEGAWFFLPLGEDLMLGGTYNGLALYQRTNDRWQFTSELKGLEESCRIFALDQQGAIWVSHPYRGVFRVRINEDLRSAELFTYGAEQGLPSNLFNYIYPIHGKAVVAAEKGIYQYNPATDRFEPDSAFSSFFDPGLRIKYLKEDVRGNIWFVAGEETGLLRVIDEGLQKRIEKKTFPQLRGKLVGGFEHIYPYDSLHVFFGSEKGFILLNPQGRPFDDPGPGKAVLREVRLITRTDSLIFGGLFSDGKNILPEQPERMRPHIPYQWNNLRFTFSAPEFSTEHPEFRHFLEGFDEDWSDWQSKTDREVANLAPGMYCFHVQYRDTEGRIADPMSYCFVIEKPWYSSSLAVAGYVLAAIGFIWGLTRYQRRRFDSEKMELTTAHQQKEAFHKNMVQRTREEVTRLQNEKLETAIQFKNRELASATMHLVQKGEMLLRIQEDLNKLLKKHHASPQLRREIQRIIGMVASDKQLDDDWKQFAYHFDQVYIDFQQRLKERYPQLSPNDFKLCSYLRMNLSSKEIASLMNISIRGVEASRYRLRKKLDLPTEVNLTEFIMAL